MELGETLEEGAKREAFEEALARIEIDGILGIFSISRIGQVQVMFRARLAANGEAPLFGVGEESLEVALFPGTVSRGTSWPSRPCAGHWMPGRPPEGPGWGRRSAIRRKIRAAPRAAVCG